MKSMAQFNRLYG